MTSIKNIFEKAVKYHSENKFLEAKKLYKKILKINPSDIHSLRHLGMIYQTQLQLNKALELYTKVWDLDKKYYPIYNNIGTILENKNLFEEAESWFEKCLNFDHNYIPALNNLSLVSSQLKKGEKALELSVRALQIDNNNENANVAYGLALMTAKQSDKAIIFYEKILKRFPNNHDLLSNLAVAHRDEGNLEKSYNLNMRAYGINNQASTTIKNLSYSKFFNPDKKMIKKIQDNYEIQKDNVDKSLIGYALHNIYEKNKDFKKSFFYLKKANEIMSQIVKFDLEKEKKYFENIKNLLPNRQSILTNADQRKNNLNKIFIVGMPRSGTSLVEQILASHSDIFGGGELSYLADACSLTLGAQHSDQQEVFDSLKKSFPVEQIFKHYNNEIQKLKIKENTITDKMPHNYLLINIIINVFPDAKIIFCNRDPMDNCLSLYKRTFGVNTIHSYLYDQKILGEYYLLHQDIMKYWKNLYKSKIFEIKYEELIEDQEKWTRNLLEFCDLLWEDECLMFYKTKRTVSTASGEQVRQPIYKDSLKSWKKYDTKLDDLKSALNYNE